jgi:hypothetical protein
LFFSGAAGEWLAGRGRKFAGHPGSHATVTRAAEEQKE